MPDVNDSGIVIALGTDFRLPAIVVWTNDDEDFEGEIYDSVGEQIPRWAIGPEDKSYITDQGVSFSPSGQMKLLNGTYLEKFPTDEPAPPVLDVQHLPISNGYTAYPIPSSIQPGIFEDCQRVLNSGLRPNDL